MKQMQRGKALLLSMFAVMVSYTVTVEVLAPVTGDYLMFWTGAKLIGPDVYNWQKAAELQREAEPRDKVFGFVRLPVYAALFWPLAQLPVLLGCFYWRLFNLIALFAFVWIWSPHPRSFLVCALFPPLWWAVGQAQETCILLLLIAAGITLIQKQKDVAGGTILGLCFVKPHLFLLLPVLLAAQRKFRALGGMLTAIGALYVTSSFVAGYDWPLKFLASIERNRQEFQLLSPGLSLVSLLSPGLSLANSYFHLPGWAMAATQVPIAALAYFAVRGKPWIPSALFILTTGAVCAPWLIYYDLSLLLPLLLTLSFEASILTIGALLAFRAPTWPIADAAMLALIWRAWPRRQEEANRQHPAIDLASSTVPALSKSTSAVG